MEIRIEGQVLFCLAGATWNTEANPSAQRKAPDVGQELELKVTATEVE